MRWDPARYAAFTDERSRPFHDLVARIAGPFHHGQEAPRRVVDLGCGPGALTATLAGRWPTARVVGVDSSAEMLADAAPVAADHPTCRSSWARSRTGRPAPRTTSS
ncbi:methyltransferase domain-containing protein [Curtobacterium sp. SL109]|uniref:methyltransferase domain-containing protein n=1 Tax=Curtobacterium sp. SL109 TaxID=2994662 RepID=UPI002DD434A3|nr:methyltransferase domain-containing protein [Curtobacterium sp. SL109]